jgi:voltage-dependent anion channel protein 2
VVATQDLGKSSTDLLGKDFYFHGSSLEVKTKTASGVTFKVAGSRNPKSEVIHGDLEAKYADFKNGITFTQTWTTANVLKSQVEVENQLAKGLKLDFLTSLVPEKNHKSAILTAIYKQSGLHTRASLDVYKVR